MTEAETEIMAALSSAGLTLKEFHKIAAALGRPFCRQMPWRWRTGKNQASESTLALVRTVALLSPEERAKLLSK